MFRKPRVNVIESDEGFSVEVLGFTGLRYTEGAKSMFVDSEILASPGGILVIKESICAWDPPYEKEVVDDEKRDAIVENIRRAFDFDGQWIRVK